MRLLWWEEALPTNVLNQQWERMTTLEKNISIARIMGLDAFHQLEDCSQFTPGARLGFEGYVFDCWYATPKDISDEDFDSKFEDYFLPDYCTDIADAMKVVKYLSDYPQSHTVVMCQPHDENHPGVMIYEGGARPYGSADVFLHLVDEDAWANSKTAQELGVKKSVRVGSKTLEDAICKAAFILANGVSIAHTDELVV